MSHVNNPDQNCQWNVQQNTHVFGAQQVQGISSLASCMAYCSSRPSCLAFDFRRSISGCYPHFNAEDLLRVGPDEDLDYYLKRSCGGQEPRFILNSVWVQQRNDMYISAPTHLLVRELSIVADLILLLNSMKCCFLYTCRQNS